MPEASAFDGEQYDVRSGRRQWVRHEVPPLDGPSLALEPQDAGARRIEHQVAHEVVTEVDVRPRNVVVLGPGTIPKTPSGKLRRANSVELVTG